MPIEWTHTSRYSGVAVRWTLVWVTALTLGCSSESQPSTASLATSLTLEQLVAGQLSEDDVAAVTDLMLGLPEQDRPAFQPAMESIESDGLKAVDLLATYRRNYLDALDAESQTRAWSENKVITDAAAEAGLDLNELAVLLTRIGCAYHAAQTGTELDVADARAAGEARIADLLPKIDAAKESLVRRSHVESLASLVAFDAYLTLLDLVPESNRRVVMEYDDRLSQLLPPTPKIEIRPALPRMASERRSATTQSPTVR